MTTAYTKNFALAMPDFRAGPWHDLVNGDFAKIDGLIYGAVSQTDVSAWQNNTDYGVGTTVLDGADATTWMCGVNHTSIPAPGTFADDRVAHPTYWVQLLNGFAPRGEWAHDTQYFPYDLTYQTAEGIFALCKVRHVSNSTGSIIDDKAYWSFLLDFSDIGAVPALAVSYNNATSGLSGTNVQLAIDQVAARTVALDNVNITQGTNISNLQAKDVVHETRMTNIENKNVSQDTAITNVTNLANSKQANLGYTPVNKAGDDMSAPLYLSRGGSIHLTLRGPSNKSIWHYMDDSNYYILMGDYNAWGGLRPFRIDNSGNVYVVESGQQVSFGGQANFNGYNAFNGYAQFNAGMGVSGTINAGVIACSGNVQGAGWQCRQGSSGAVQGNVVNHSWTGSEAQCWIDNTKVNTVYVVCDPRIKKDVLPLDFDALGLVNQMEPVSFRYKDISIFKDDGKRHIGFLADALAKVLPDLVYGEIDGKTSDGDIQPMGLNLTPIMVVLVKAVQELSTRVEELCKLHNKDA
jgi:hypothetical protein